MAQSPNERITAVEQTLGSLTTRVEILADEADGVDDELRELTKEVAEFERVSDREVAKVSTHLEMLVEKIDASKS